MKFARGKDTKGQHWRKNWGRKGDTIGRGKSDLAGKAKSFWSYINIFYYTGRADRETQLGKKEQMNKYIVKRKIEIKHWTKWKW